MADTLVNLTTTLALEAEESITIPVYGQLVVTSLEDGDEEVAK